MRPSQTFIFKGRPKPKERPRPGKGGRIYTPKATKDAEKALADQYDGPRFEGPIEVAIWFERDRTVVNIAEAADPKSKLRGDLDNYVKTVLDALNKVAFDDDSQVVRLEAVKVQETLAL